MILYIHKKRGEKRTMSYDELLEKYNILNAKYENVKLENQNLRRIIYGVKREYTPKQEQVENCMQCSLFENNEELDPKIEEEVKEKVEEITIHKRKKSKTKKAGIKKSELKNVEVEVIEHTINDEERCPECNGELVKVGSKVVRSEIEYIPAKLKITNHVEVTYKCKECGGKNSDNDKVIFVTTKAPKPLLTHSFASPSLAAEVIYQKYYLGVPLYRQEKMWDDKGLILPRNMMANWNIKITEYYLEYLYNLMLKTLKEENELM